MSRHWATKNFLRWDDSSSSPVSIPVFSTTDVLRILFRPFPTSFLRSHTTLHVIQHRLLLIYASGAQTDCLTYLVSQKGLI